MFKKALRIIFNFGLSKELGLALNILNLLLPLANRLNGLDLARLVYSRLPENWKFPNGPATEDEFLDTIQSGQIFLGKVKALTNR